MDNNTRWSELCNVFLVVWAFKNTQLFACNANVNSSKEPEWYHLNKQDGMNINLGSLGIIHTLTRCTDKPKENHIHDCWHSLIFFYKYECICIFIVKTLAVFKVIVIQKRESSVPCMLHQATGCSLWTIPTPKGALQCHQICSAAKKRFYIWVNLLPLMLFDPHQPLVSNSRQTLLRSPYCTWISGAPTRQFQVDRPLQSSTSRPGQSRSQFSSPRSHPRGAYAALACLPAAAGSP